jgi:hypothetical protein
MENVKVTEVLVLSRAPGNLMAELSKSHGIILLEVSKKGTYGRTSYRDTAEAFVV